MTFATAMVHILKEEGGYVSDPVDRGGATNMGITQKSYNEWRIAQTLPVVDVKDIPPVEVENIYRERYWTPARCPALTNRVALAHFDAAVQHGVERAAKLLQRSVGVVEDGVIGPATISAANTIPEDRCLALMLMERRAFYLGIVASRPEQEKFLLGWTKRLRHLAVAVWP